MYEVFPFVVGVLAALVVQRLGTARQRSIALVILSVLGGATASLISGELAVSWTYMIFNIVLVSLAATVTTLALAWWQRQTTGRH